MNATQTKRAIVLTTNGILILLALLRLSTLLATNGQSGWHRDELDMLESARHLEWGYVSYPPVTAFIARVALSLFGPSMTGVRLFSTLAQALAMLLTGWMARELGGKRWAQVASAVAVMVVPYSLLAGELFHYSSFDYLWWVLIAYQMIRLLKSDNPRWWLGIGAAIGVGMMTKYTLSFLVVGIVVGVLLTRARRHLTSPWLWCGVALSLMIVSPNLIWQLRHNWISLEFLRSIHTRDVRIGRAEGFLVEQLLFAANPVTISLWLTGLYFYFLSRMGSRYRLLGWMFVVPFALFYVAQGRSYYFAPAYPMLFAGGAVAAEQWLSSLAAMPARRVRMALWAALAIGGVAFAAIALPAAPVNSRWWVVASGINGELKEEIGWPELVRTVADVYAARPAEERLHTGILAGNYGELGAINLYGPAYGLPQAISGVNSYWLRGYGDPPPQTVIVVGLGSYHMRLFESCRVAGRVTNPYGVQNEESRDHPVIYVCRGPRGSWPDLWKLLQTFG